MRGQRKPAPYLVGWLADLSVARKLRIDFSCARHGAIGLGEIGIRLASGRLQGVRNLRANLARLYRDLRDVLIAFGLEHLRSDLGMGASPADDAVYSAL